MPPFPTPRLGAKMPDVFVRDAADCAERRKHRASALRIVSAGRSRRRKPAPTHRLARASLPPAPGSAVVRFIRGDDSNRSAASPVASRRESARRAHCARFRETLRARVALGWRRRAFPASGRLRIHAGRCDEHRARGAARTAARTTQARHRAADERAPRPAGRPRDAGLRSCRKALAPKRQFATRCGRSAPKSATFIQPAAVIVLRGRDGFLRPDAVPATPRAPLHSARARPRKHRKCTDCSRRRSIRRSRAGAGGPAADRRRDACPSLQCSHALRLAPILHDRAP